MWCNLSHLSKVYLNNSGFLQFLNQDHIISARFAPNLNHRQ